MLSRDPHCNDKWHKNVVLIMVLIPVLLLKPAVLSPPPTHAPGRAFLSHEFKVEIVGISKAGSFVFVMFIWRNVISRLDEMFLTCVPT